jgi:hypothetical protein
MPVKAFDSSCAVTLSGRPGPQRLYLAAGRLVRANDFRLLSAKIRSERKLHEDLTIVFARDEPNAELV